MLTLDADQITRIFAYTIMKSGITDIVAHICLIEDFTTAELQESHQGQALVSLKSATTLLIEQQFNFCKDPNQALKLHQESFRKSLIHRVEP